MESEALSLCRVRPVSQHDSLNAIWKATLGSAADSKQKNLARSSYYEYYCDTAIVIDDGRINLTRHATVSSESSLLMLAPLTMKHRAAHNSRDSVYQMQC